MQAFQVPEMSPARFVDGIADEISRRELERYVSVTFDGRDLVARISKLGTTVLRYAVTRVEGGFEATLRSRRVAPLHAVYRTDFEEVLERVVRRAGGRVGR